MATLLFYIEISQQVAHTTQSIVYRRNSGIKQARRQLTPGNTGAILFLPKNYSGQPPKDACLANGDIMLKVDILAEAKNAPCLPAPVLKVAASSISDTTALLALAKVKARMRKVDIASNSAFALTSIGVLCNVLPGVMSSETVDSFGRGFQAIAVVILSLLGGLILAALVRTVLASSLRATASHELAYTPISGTSMCKDALECLEGGGELVLAWRNLALSERNQLLGLDVEIMKALRSRDAHYVGKVRREKELAEACRKVHGIPLPPLQEA